VDPAPNTCDGATNGEGVAAFDAYWHLVTTAGPATVMLEPSLNGPVLATPTAFGTSRSLYRLTLRSVAHGHLLGTLYGYLAAIDN
jgi:hypothetical protein